MSAYRLLAAAIPVVTEICLNPEVHSRDQKAGVSLLRQGHMFCWASDHHFAVKLPVLRVQDLMQAKLGKRFRPAPDRCTWEWVELTGQEGLWRELTWEAYRYVSSLEHRGPSCHDGK